jgi:hypothetical protein
MGSTGREEDNLAVVFSLFRTPVTGMYFSKFNVIPTYLQKQQRERETQ